jgi:hypothetical protein
MGKFTHFFDFLAYVFDYGRSVEKPKAITAGILKARSCHLSDIA